MVWYDSHVIQTATGVCPNLQQMRDTVMKDLRVLAALYGIISRAQKVRDP